MRATPVLLCVLLLLGSAAASPLSPTRLSWQVQEEAVVMEPGRFSMWPVGDVDGDGMDDVVFQAYDDDVLQALAGPDLTRSLWKMDQQNGIWGMTPDMDGDGVADLLSFLSWDANGVGYGQGAGGFSAYASNSETSYTEGLLSGRDGTTITSFGEAWSDTSARTSGYTSAGPAYAFMYARAGTSGAAYSFPIGPDQTWAIRVEALSAYGYAFTTGGGEFVSQRAETGVSFTREDFSGKELFTLTFDDPMAELWNVIFADVNGDGTQDLVASELPREIRAEYEGLATAGVKRLTAYDGATGAVLWQDAGEPGVEPLRESSVELLPIGDIDGDGATDLTFIDVTWDVLTGAVEGRSAVLSGRDGSALYEVDLAETIGLAVAYGDIDGGGAEFAWLSFDSIYAEDVTFTVRSPTKEHWSMPLDDGFWVLNFEGFMGGFTDVTGDGAADVVTVESDGDPWDDDAKLTVRVLDGKTGNEVWSLAVGTVLEISVIMDSTGDGAPDLHVIKQKDQNTTLETYSAATGQSAWKRAIMTPELAGNRSSTDIWTDIADMGDLDGDGAKDIGVWLESWCFESYGEPMEAEAELDECVELEQRLILSGASGSILWMSPVLGDSSEAALPAVEPGELLDVPGTTTTKESPMPAVLALLAVLGAVAVLRLRRS